MPSEKITLKDIIIFNCNTLEDIDMMFYTENTVYGCGLSENQYIDLKAKNTKIAVFADHGAYVTPGFLKKDNTIYVIPNILE